MNLFVGGVSLAWTGIDSQPRRRYSLKRTVYSSRRPTMEQLRKVPQNSNFRGRTNEAATKEKRKRPHAKSTPLLLGALHAPSHYCSSKEGGSRERKGRTDGRTTKASLASSSSSSPFFLSLLRSGAAQCCQMSCIHIQPIKQFCNLFDGCIILCP